MATFRDIKLNAIDEDVEDALYINQLCKLAIAVPVGSVPLKEDFGSTIPDIIDAPLSAPTVAAAQSGCYNAINGLIDGLELVSVSVSKDISDKLKVVPNVNYDGVEL